MAQVAARAVLAHRWLEDKVRPGYRVCRGWGGQRQTATSLPLVTSIGVPTPFPYFTRQGLPVLLPSSGKAYLSFFCLEGGLLTFSQREHNGVSLNLYCQGEEQVRKFITWGQTFTR